MEPFVILGASKTGTSTAVAVANAHPAVFCLFECDFSRAPDYARNKELVDALPTAAGLFGNRDTFGTCLSVVHNSLVECGWHFSRLGTKVQGIRPDLLPQIGPIPALFMVRDVRLWAVKNRILRDVMAARTATNVVPFLTAYARYFLDSFLLERCIRLPLDRVLSTDLSVFPRAMESVLGLPHADFERWWLKAPAWKDTAPKNYSDWTQGHASAFVPPLLADTTSALASHPFWDEFLPVFDKYFAASDGSFAAPEIASDQQTLAHIAARHTMRLEEGFTRFESFKIMGLSKRDDGKLKIDATDRVTHADIDAAAERWRLPDAL